MIKIMQEYGETVCVVGGGLSMSNAELFFRGDTAIALSPVLPRLCGHLGSVDGGGEPSKPELAETGDESQRLLESGYHSLHSTQSKLVSCLLLWVIWTCSRRSMCLVLTKCENQPVAGMCMFFAYTTKNELTYLAYCVDQSSL